MGRRVTPDPAHHVARRPIPRRVPQRVEFFEALWEAIEHDALATVDELRAGGWTEDGIACCMTGYREWITGNIAVAVELARIAGGVAA